LGNFLITTIRAVLAPNQTVM